MCITMVGQYPVVLGLPGLRLHDAVICFASNTVASGSEYFTIHCYDAPVTVQEVKEEPLQPEYSVKEIFEPHIQPLRLFQGNNSIL